MLNGYKSIGCVYQLNPIWPNLRRLSFFKALAETASFTDAAERCGVSQPGLSAGIREFEQELGVRLFQRDTRNVRLTEEGMALLPLVEVSLNNAMQSAKDIRDLIETKRNKVRVAAVSSITSHVLPKLIAEFETLHSGVKVEVVDVINNERVYDGRADIGIGLGPFDLSRFETTFLFSDPLAVVVSKRHPFARLEEVTWAEVGLQPIVSYHPRSHVYEMIDRALAAQGIRYEPRGTFQFRQTLFGWALSAHAVTILPSLSLEWTMPAGLVHIPLTSPVVDRQYFIFTRKGRALVRQAQDLLDHLKRRLVEARSES